MVLLLRAEGGEKETQVVETYCLLEFTPRGLCEGLKQGSLCKGGWAVGRKKKEKEARGALAIGSWLRSEWGADL
jgi:hypothetical protein